MHTQITIVHLNFVYVRTWTPECTIMVLRIFIQCRLFRRCFSPRRIRHRSSRNFFSSICLLRGYVCVVWWMNKCVVVCVLFMCGLYLIWIAFALVWCEWVRRTRILWEFEYLSYRRGRVVSERMWNAFAWLLVPLFQIKSNFANKKAIRLWAARVCCELLRPWISRAQVYCKIVWCDFRGRNFDSIRIRRVLQASSPANKRLFVDSSSSSPAIFRIQYCWRNACLGSSGGFCTECANECLVFQWASGQDSRNEIQPADVHYSSSSLTSSTSVKTTKNKHKQQELFTEEEF